MQVLSQAGGATDAADTSDVSIASKLPDGKTVTVMYDIDDIKKNKVKDPAVIPGDIIIVGTSFIKGLVTGFSNTARGFVAPIGR
jgi:protein involved in polysaccharide export with SLBB domain